MPKNAPKGEGAANTYDNAGQRIGRKQQSGNLPDRQDVVETSLKMRKQWGDRFLNWIINLTR